MNPRHVALRRLTGQVVAATASGTVLDIRGGGSKTFYGGPVRGEPLDVGDVTGITSYEPTELVITAFAGTLLSEIESVLADDGQCLPFEPPRFAATGTVGGMVAAGLSGPARSCVGSVRDHVLGMSIINGRGENLTFGGQVMKNVAGYDVSRLFCGSLGILGVIGEVSLKVMPVVPASTTLCFEMDEASALAQLNRWAGQPVSLNASAWHRGLLYVRISGAKAAVTGVSARLGGARIDAAAADPWWNAVRDQTHDFFSFTTGQLEAGERLWRLSLPDTAAPLALQGEQFLEWGGAQRWLRSTADAYGIRAAAAGCGGHATLVRAVDKSCGVFAAVSAPLMAIHRRLKDAFDPAGIFNPGRLYPEL